MIAGKTIISEEVFIELAKTAMSKVENVITGFGQKGSLATIAKIVADKVAPQINVKKSDMVDVSPDEQAPAPFVNFELKINITYGQSIPATIANVREAVKTEVEKITGYKVEKIDVIVEKLVKPEPVEAPAE